MVEVYGFSKVNPVAHGHTRDLRVLWVLEEMGLPYRIAGMDHPAHDLDTPAYRRMSPFSQIPAIDDDGLVISESAAILHYLARKTGRLMPGDTAGQAQVTRWCFAAMNTVEIPLLALVVLDWSADGGCGKHREFLVGWCKRVLGNLDLWLAGREYVATPEFTIADILMAHVLTQMKDDQLVAPYERVVAYRARCFARPAWQRTIAAYRERVVAG